MDQNPSSHHVGPEPSGEPVFGWLGAGKKWYMVCSDSADGPGGETLGMGQREGKLLWF